MILSGKNIGRHQKREKKNPGGRVRQKIDRKENPSISLSKPETTRLLSNNAWPEKDGQAQKSLLITEEERRNRERNCNGDHPSKNKGPNL